MGRGWGGWKRKRDREGQNEREGKSERQNERERESRFKGVKREETKSSFSQLLVCYSQSTCSLPQVDLGSKENLLFIGFYEYTF